MGWQIDPATSALGLYQEGAIDLPGFFPESEFEQALKADFRSTWVAQ